MGSPRQDVTKALSNNTHEKWWKDPGMRRLNFMIVCVITAQMTCGYDEAVVGNFQAMKPWLRDMSYPDASHIGLITTIIFVGGFIGSFPASPVADLYGRKAAMYIGSIFTLVGTIIQTSAFGYAQFMVGRCLLGVGISFTCVAGPSMVAELAHPRQRGTVLGFFNTFWYVGAIVAAWGSFGSGHLTTSSWSWRIPSLIQGVAPIFLMIMLPFMPESPRFLLAKGREQEARKVLAEFHANGSMDDELVLHEIEEINLALAIENQYREVGWSVLWNTDANRKKMGIAISSFILCLWCGQGVISYYFSPLLTSLNIKSTNQQTGINGGMQIWNFLISILGACLADKIGRRSLWLLSLFSMLGSNIGITVTSALFAKTPNNATAYTAVVFLFLYNAGFNVACNPLAYSYPTEILPYSMRTKGLSVMVAIGQALLIVSQYANPVAIENIGWKYWIFFMGMLVLFIAMVWFTYPETKGLTLEELAGLFEEGGVGSAVVGIEKMEGLEVDGDVEKGGMHVVGVAEKEKKIEKL
ncbi:general substrate transporter [Tricladium varicosporioides]|nr:general substrate transporter [Hymenoscyphus varicosporioides]